MTDLERMFRVLVTTMTSRSPEQLTRPFEVADLYQNILPYRLFRRELALETNQEYELTLMQLLSGAGGYLNVDDRMRDVLSRELANPTPDSTIFRQFATAQVTIAPDALARVAELPALSAHESPARARPDHHAAPTVAGARETTSGAMSASPAPEPAPPRRASRRGPIVPAAGEACRFCAGQLPDGRAITFCPHCGQDQTVLHCDACGTELEVGWKFCTTCGRKVGEG